MEGERSVGQLAAIMAEAFDSIDLGVLVLDASDQIVFVNDGCLRLFELDDRMCHAGANFVDMVWVLADRGEFGGGTVEAIVTERLLPIRQRQKIRLERARPDGRIVAETGAPLPSGGYTYTFSDATEEHRAAERQRSAGRATVLALANLAEYRDTDTGDHVVRVARLTHEITASLERDHGLGEVITTDFRQHIGVASMLHDVGKVAISDNLLRKPGRFTPEERLEMQEHSAVGAALLGKARILAPDSVYLKIAEEVARYHHERYDGDGYPDGLAGKDIPLAARIVAVADVFDALTSERPYKQPWRQEDAMAHLTEQAGAQFDPQVIAALQRVMEERRETPVFSWSPDMSVGNPALDHDHQILIALINQLAQPNNRSDRVVQEFVLDELLGYTVAHFAREEEHMEAIGFRGRYRHILIHRALTSELAAIRARFLIGTQDIAEDVFDFVSGWLRNHILQEDMGYSEKS